LNGSAQAKMLKGVVDVRELERERERERERGWANKF
jgi:hypothetical protein